MNAQTLLESVPSLSTPGAELSAARLANVRGAMADAGIDWIVAASPANVAYASGYRSVQGDIMPSHRMAVLVGTDDLWLVGPCADSAPALDAGIAADRYVSYGRFFFESPDGRATPTMLVDQHDSFEQALRTAVRAAVTSGATVGVDDTVDEAVSAVVSQLPTVSRVADTGGLLRSLRRVKLPAEVERLARAARLAEAGIEAALQGAGTGQTEEEMANVVASTMAAGGGAPRFVVVTTGKRSALADARPTTRPWEPGELLRFDVGCVVDGYWSDIGRTAVLGEPDAIQRDRYEAILAGVDAQLEALRPGLNASALFDIAVTAVQANGLAPYRRQHCGHGIGSEIYEPPIISPAYDDELAEGMVFCLETPFYELGWGGMMVEDTVIVTANGHERLSRSDRSLRVVAG